MLFSEPKIPQYNYPNIVVIRSASFSALQRAENSSIQHASWWAIPHTGFSALQRAENSSIPLRIPSISAAPSEFQCSSASRKFLNPAARRVRAVGLWFQCSSASRKFLNNNTLFFIAYLYDVSVLFSEPKIPQSAGKRKPRACEARFSALQRAENSSMLDPSR